MVWFVSIFDHNDFLNSMKNDDENINPRLLIEFSLIGKKEELLTEINKKIEEINQTLNGVKIPCLMMHQLNGICCKTATSLKYGFIRKYIIIRKKEVQKAHSNEENENTQLKRRIDELEQNLESVITILKKGGLIPN